MKPTVAKVLGSDCRALAADLLTQPELLRGVFTDSQGQPTNDQDERVEAVKRYTGSRSTLDEQRLLMVGALRLLGASDREIESACGCTRRTIPVLLAELERAGRVTPLKERLVQIVGDNAERSSLLLKKLMEQAMDGACDMDLAAMLKAVGSVNCFQLEKFQLLTGQATEIVEQRVAADRDEFERWWRETALPVSAQIESKSSALHENTNENAGFMLGDTPVIRPVAASQPKPTAEPQAAGGASACPAMPEG
jgi:hypothetical protein